MLKDINSWIENTMILGKKIPIITSPSLKLRNGTYDPKGLFSMEYFGQANSPQWRQMYSAIKLPVPILHPAIYYTIDRRISTLKKWINLNIGAKKEATGFVLTNNTNEYDLSGLIDLNINTGMVYEFFQKQNKVNSQSFSSVLSLLMKKPHKAWTNYIVVPPPLFRPDGDDINKFYSKIIEELQILNSAISSNDKLLKNKILASIQYLYHQIFLMIVDKIKGKKGAVRSSMLGRTMDFSARCVITGDPTLDADHMGIPRSVLVRIFFPWVIHYILNNKEVANELSKYTAINKASLSVLINQKFINDDTSKEVNYILYKVVDEVIKDKVVVFKRDPCLHKLSIRAYYPVPIDGNTIHICPAICAGHNADFDGDQAAVFVPMTKEAQEEAKNKMLPSNCIWAPKGGLSVSLEKDFPAMVYFMTLKDPEGEVVRIDPKTDILEVLKKAEKLHQRIEYRGKVNSLGRRLMELTFNDEITVNEPITRKKLDAYFEQFARSKGGKFVVHAMWVVQQFTSIINTIIGGDIGVDSFTLTDDLAKRRDTVLAHTDKFDVSTELKNITEEFEKRACETGQFAALAKVSGAEKKINFQQLSVAKGYIADVNGNTDPVPLKSNFVEGFQSVDYFKAAAGARKGVVDRSQNTAKSGYLTRQLVYLLASVKAGQSKDCGTNRFFEFILTDDTAEMVLGRILSDGTVVTKEVIEDRKLIGKKIALYSPMYCKDKQLCRKCLPPSSRIYTNDTENIGILSGATAGEILSQSIMKSFHTGGASSIVYLVKECPETEPYISQDNLSLTAKKDIIIRLEDADEEEANIYNSRGFIIVDGDIEINVDFSVAIDFDGVAASKVTQEGKTVLLYFEKGITIGEMSASATDVTNATESVQKLLNKAGQFNDGADMVMELFDNIKVSTKIPLFYLEVIVSQIMRDPDNKRIPYRLGDMTKEPFFAAIKTVAGLESNIRGQLFEKFSDIIVKDIIEGDPEESEKIMHSDFEELYEL